MIGDVNRVLVRGEASGRSPPPRRRLRIAAPSEPGAITFYNHPHTQRLIDRIQASIQWKLLVISICLSAFHPPFLWKRENIMRCAFGCRRRGGGKGKRRRARQSARDGGFKGVCTYTTTWINLYTHNFWYRYTGMQRHIHVICCEPFF
jgi:hypothetical protein